MVFICSKEPPKVKDEYVLRLVNDFTISAMFNRKIAWISKYENLKEIINQYDYKVIGVVYKSFFEYINEIYDDEKINSIKKEIEKLKIFSLDGHFSFYITVPEEIYAYFSLIAL